MRRTQTANRLVVPVPQLRRRQKAPLRSPLAPTGEIIGIGLSDQLDDAIRKSIAVRAVAPVQDYGVLLLAVADDLAAVAIEHWLGGQAAPNAPVSFLHRAIDDDEADCQNFDSGKAEQPALPQRPKPDQPQSAPPSCQGSVPPKPTASPAWRSAVVGGREVVKRDDLL